MTEYRTTTLTLTAGEAGELCDLDLSGACQSINLDVDLVKYTQFDDEPRHGWEIDRAELWIKDEDGHIVSDPAAIALRLGKAMIEAIKAKMLEDY